MGRCCALLPGLCAAVTHVILGRQAGSHAPKQAVLRMVYRCLLPLHAIHMQGRGPANTCIAALSLGQVPPPAEPPLPP